MKINRSAGILLPIFSLPSKYGIGTLGKQAYKFVDFLVSSKQSYWQILPIGPTSYGDSPYQSFSSNAGNPYFIDLDELVNEGLLNKKDLSKLKNDKYIDYGYIYETRFNILFKAYQKGIKTQAVEFKQFVSINQKWLENYALFMACKKHFEMKSWLDWPDEKLKTFNSNAIKKYKEVLKEDMEFYEFIQYLFFKQYYKLKAYANNKGIKIIGDLPIYVSLDSADVWSNPSEFQLDEKHNPTNVAGVPPDYFSKTGQLWGNPLYDWQKMESNGFKWWIERIEQTAKYFDVIRLDHFRGFQDYWSVPAKEKTAINGKWIKGPSSRFIGILRDWFCNVSFIAEDLGIITDDVAKLLLESGFPGMKVLEFGTDKKKANCHMPQNHTNNCVCYISTHDNAPIQGWWKTLDQKTKDYILNYYNINEDNLNESLIKVGMASVANLFIGQFQDYLNLDEEATINTPGTINNWKWRADQKDINNALAKKIANLTQTYSR